MLRSVYGPRKDWLTLEEAAAWMRISSGTLEGLVEAGRFPPGSRVSGADGRKRVWPWMDCVAYMHLLTRMPNAEDTVEELPKPAKKARSAEES